MSARISEFCESPCRRIDRREPRGRPCEHEAPNIERRDSKQPSALEEDPLIDRPNRLILLVDGNPLPNYLAAMTLRPCEVRLVHSSETEGPAKQLKKALEEDLANANSEPVIERDKINDPACAQEVFRRLRKLMRNDAHSTHLHYSGGTKVMSAHALIAFNAAGGLQGNASYLDEKEGLLRLDDGTTGTLQDKHPLTLKRILQLHEVQSKGRSEVEGGPTLKDAQAVLEEVLRKPELAAALYERIEGTRKAGHCRKDGKDAEVPAAAERFSPQDFNLDLSVPEIPEDGSWPSKRLECWRKFLKGEWLEEWCGQLVRRLCPSGSVSVGVNCTRIPSNRRFEVDIAVVRAHRAYFISCTTSDVLRECKLKAFEVAIRARQMGGDLARSALICLLESESSSVTKIQQLRQDVETVWGAVNPTMIYGLGDLKAWSGHFHHPNCEGLKSWLDS